MGIVFRKGIFAMQGIIEREIIDLTRYLHVKAENGENFGVIYKRLLQACPRLHDDEQHKKLAEKFVADFIKEFSAHDLRIWFEVNAPMTFGDERLHSKYYNLLKIHDAFIDKWLKEHDLTLKVDVYLFGNRVRDAYRDVGISFTNSSFSYVTEYTTQLWGLIKTIDDNHYNKELIHALEHSIKVLLQFSGGHYYLSMDLTDEKVLKELYEVLGEVLHMSDSFMGDEWCHSYNGYGDVIFNPTGEIVF